MLIYRLITNVEPFQPGWVVFFALIIALYIVVFIFTSLFYLNSKAKIYSKMRVKATNFVLITFVLVLFLALAIAVTVFYFTRTTEFFNNNFFIIPLSWVLVGLAIIHILFLVFAKISVDKNKKNVTKFREENFQVLLDKLDEHKPSEEYLQNFKKKHIRYCTTLEQRYSIINTILDAYKPDMYQQVLVDIIMFNDVNTTKTGKKSNFMQLKMFYDLCIKLQQKIK